MDENSFIDILKRNLKGISSQDREEILSDYKEHFLIGREEGISDYDICESLGDPKQIGINSSSELKVVESGAENIFKAVIASISLIFFNLVFILGPYLGLVGGIIGLWATVISLTISGALTSVAVIFRPLLTFIFSSAQFPPGFILNFALFLAGVLIFALGALGVIGMIKLSKLFYMGTVNYVSYNLKIILRR